MDISAQYIGLAAGYGAAVLIVWLIKAALKPAFLNNPAPQFAKPWLELGLVLVAAVAVVGVGQLYTAKMLLPQGPALNEILNQLIIFSPMIVVVAVRPQPFRSAYIPPAGAVPGLVLGVGLALAALFAYAAAHGSVGSYGDLLAGMAKPERAQNALQVFLEDFAIAALLARLTQVATVKGAVIVVAVLFALAHVPAMLSNGASVEALSNLVLDTLLGTAVMGTVVATRSIWWFFPVHVVMDLTQFAQH